MSHRVAAAVVFLALSGCSQAHVACHEPPPAGHYRITLRSVDGECFDSIEIEDRFPEGLAPWWCDVIARDDQACGAGIVYRCPANTASLNAAMDVDADLTWTKNGAEGGATVTLYWPEGHCTTEADVEAESL